MIIALYFVTFLDCRSVFDVYVHFKCSNCLHFVSDQSSFTVHNTQLLNCYDSFNVHPWPGMRHKSQPSGARLLVPSHYKVHHREGAFSMKTLRLELMIYAVGSWVVRYTLALREFLMLGKPMFAAGRLPFFCLLSLEIIDTCFPPRACPGHYKYLSILCRVSFIAFSVFYVKGKIGTSFIVELESSSQGFYIFLFFLVIIHS